jgi:hypothetical protein
MANKKDDLSAHIYNVNNCTYDNADYNPDLYWIELEPGTEAEIPFPPLTEEPLEMKTKNYDAGGNPTTYHFPHRS